MGKNTSLLSYSDVPTNTYDAFCWAVGAGVIQGTTATTLAPQATTTRAEVSQMLMNYCSDQVILE